jgi:hypothetical protein
MMTSGAVMTAGGSIRPRWVDRAAWSMVSGQVNRHVSTILGVQAHGVLEIARLRSKLVYDDSQVAQD